MADLHKYHAKICYTAAGLLINDEKVLFIKHKKLGIWFAPGGHIDEGELPHQAAEREFWEETGIKVKAVDPHFNLYQSKESEYLPSSFETNLHWVSEENYHNRIKSENPNKRFETALWPRGCEQHLGFLYLMEPVGSLKFKENTEETDGIGWFTIDEVDELETMDDIRMEVRHALEIIKQAEKIKITF